MDRRLATSALLGAVVVAGACRPSTVVIEPEVDVGDRTGYRYEIEATLTRSLEGGEPDTTTITTELVADQEVVTLTEAGAEAEVTLRRDGGPARSARVRLDRSGAIQGVELVEGLGTGTIGLEELGALLPASSAPPPTPLAPGARWAIDSGPLSGTGRLHRLAVVDGVDVAVVSTALRESVHEAVATGTSAVDLDGVLHSRSTASYEIADGSLRRSIARTSGDLQAVIAPPEGVHAAPVDATITYEIEIRVTRLR